ncbi:hypothetical protein [Enterococcus faecalis]|uniref:hypothetical protein n=1 Tax=Enterococcus faecalis TaxID=1351 RepID=UPI00242B5AA4|nr:hypothetical protein [Enterococcus faecalis]
MPVKETSKFDFEIFYIDDKICGAFNKQKYTKKQAIEAWQNELFDSEGISFIVDESFVRWYRGYDEEVRYTEWWLDEGEPQVNSVPVWIIREES